jgi:hypothetical protein
MSQKNTVSSRFFNQALSVGLVFLTPVLVSAQGFKKLNNPLDPSLGSIPALLLAILNVVIIIAMPIVALYIIYAGFSYVAAQGNPVKVQEATRALTFGVIGGVIIVGAVAILAIIRNLVAAF